MRKTLFTMSAAAALAGLLSSPAAAQSGSEEKPRTDTPAASQSQDQPGQEGSQSRSDRQFIDKAANDGLAEVKLGQLASEKASNSDVTCANEVLPSITFLISKVPLSGP